MAFEFSKVYSSDFATILPLLNKFQSPLSDAQKQKLFRSFWQSPVDFCGVKVEDEGKVIAYLGLIFSERFFESKGFIFCNLTSLIVDESYRGQKLTHRIIQYVQSLGDFTLTAITPIPSLYKMYESNGFKTLNDFRTIFWRKLFVEKSQGIISFDWKSKSEPISNEHLKIADDHRQFNCNIFTFSIGNEYALIVTKNRIAQRKKFITSRLLNYADFLSRKILRKSFLDVSMNCPEVHYCSNYPFLIKNFSAFANAFFNHFVSNSCVCLRADVVQQIGVSYFLKSNFYHSRQMFFSSELNQFQYDTLYSEIFVLDM